MTLFVYIVIAVLGVSVGSYLNSWMWRVHEGQWRWGGLSKCVHCSRPLAAWENIPLLSFIVLRGKCKTCGGSIPADYFWVELITPLLLIGVTYYHLHFISINPWHYFRDIFFTIVLVSIFVYDLKYMEIRSGVVYGATIAALAINYHLGLSTYSILLGMAIGAGFFLAQYLFSHGRWIGGGDIRLGVLMGALLGWPVILVALFLSYILGAVYAIPVLIMKKKGMNSEVPFGTFLSVGAFIALLWGEAVVKWYLGLIRL